MGLVRKKVPVLLGGAAIAAALALLSPLASDHPDALEKIGTERGAEERKVVSAPLADYDAPFFESPRVRKIAAGLAGTAAVLALLLGGGKLLARRRSRAGAGS